MNLKNVRRPLSAALLCALALRCGCALRPRDKTVVLPTPNREEQTAQQEQGSDWTVRKIRQYEYATRAVGLDPYTTSVGWTQGDLFTVSGAPGEEVSILRVDPRYGFYETCAELGVIDYNRLLLSPDGAYALYDSVDEKGQYIFLTLYDVATGEKHVIADYVNPGPYLMLDFAWSGDGAYFFYWFTVNDNDRIYRREEERYGGLPGVEYYFENIFFRGLPLTSVIRCRADTRSKSTVLDLKGEINGDVEYAYKSMDLSAFCYEDVFVTDDGSKLLALYKKYDSSASVLVECGSGAYLQQENASYEHLLERDYVFSIQVTPQYIAGISVGGDRIVPLVSSGSRVTYLNALASNVYIDMKITPDEEHIITVEHGEEGSSGVYLYQFLPDAAAPVSGRRLLYQTTRSIYDVRVTQDQKQILIFIKNEGAELVMENSYLEDEYPAALYTVVILEL